MRSLLATVLLRAVKIRGLSSKVTHMYHGDVSKVGESYAIREVSRR